MKHSRLRRLLHLQSSRLWRLLRRNRLALAASIFALVGLTLASRILVACYLANDAPGDGVVYARLATNLLDHGTFSVEEEAPFSPTLIRVPGYPIFIAGVYYVFGHDNNTAVRVVQAVIDTATCLLAAIIAWLWTAGRRRRRAALWTFVLMSACPFIVIYSALILTETLTTFFMVAMVLTATLAVRSESLLRSSCWWAVVGLLGGIAVMIRPDAGLFVGGSGLTLTIAGLLLDRGGGLFRKRVISVVMKGAVLTVVFVLVLTPWTIRNWRLFGVFQPLSPAHAEMPGEFVAFGYFRWLRTWVDDSRFTESMLWNLDDKPIRLVSVPASAFDSVDEKQQVATLLDQYNNPPGTHNKPADDSDEEDNGDDASSANDNSGDQSADSDEAVTDDNSENSGDDSDTDDEDAVVKMTPEIDVGFARIADERIARSPLRYYFWTPVKRAGALWFDSHSLYYPFGGQMSKISDLDYDESQQYWLPLFTLLTWSYTIVGLAGIVVMLRDSVMLKWLVMLALMTLPRLIFFATVENPEPRYVVELFVFTAIAGGIWLARRQRHKKQRPELSSERLVSLDVFRGVTIAAMVLVNEPGTWDAIYSQLKHAEWNGATVADWIFPFFLFIVGVSIVFAYAKYRADPRRSYVKIARRAALLSGLGLLLNAFPIYNLWTGEWFDPAHLRVMGVLQRIAICYAVAALIFLNTRWRIHAVITGGLLLGYWALITIAHVPGCDYASAVDTTCNLAAYVDVTVLGRDHMWSQAQVVDPEGILSTLPAIATTLLGVLAGQFLKNESGQKTRSMLIAGAAAFAAGWLWSFLFPLNKSLWTSSYVLYTGGLAIICLGILHWVIDVKGWKAWAKPFVVFGTNAIALFVGSSVFGITLGTVELDLGETTQTLQERIFNVWFLPYAEPINASLLYGVSFLVVWLAIIWVLYRRRIFLKV